MGLTSILTLSCNDFATGLRFEVAVHLLRLNLRIEIYSALDQPFTILGLARDKPVPGRTYSRDTVTRIPAEIAEFNSSIWSVEP